VPSLSEVPTSLESATHAERRPVRQQELRTGSDRGMGL